MDILHAQRVDVNSNDFKIAHIDNNMYNVNAAPPNNLFAYIHSRNRCQGCQMV
jgi:hypothetical protein